MHFLTDTSLLVHLADTVLGRLDRSVRVVCNRRNIILVGAYEYDVGTRGTAAA
jgi:hypothetical protein